MIGIIAFKQSFYHLILISLVYVKDLHNVLVDGGTSQNEMNGRS